MDYTSTDGSSQTKLTCQEHVSERIVDQIVDVRVPLSIWEETVAVMNLAPHEHTQTTQKTVEKSQPQSINKAYDRVKTQRQIPVQVEMTRSSQEVSDSIQEQSGRPELSNRERTPENRCRKNSSRERSRSKITEQKVQKKIELPQSQLTQETMRSEIRRMKLEKTFGE